MRMAKMLTGQKTGASRSRWEVLSPVCDLPLKFHPAAVRASANVTPFGAASVPA